MKLMKSVYCSKWIALIGILILFAGCKNINEKELQSELENLTAKLVPDQRMTICKPVIKTGSGGIFILTGETTDASVKSEIINTLNNHGIGLIDSMLLLPDTLRNKKYMGLVSLSVINLRKKPDHAAELVSQAIMGTPLLILKSEDSWLLVQTPDKYIAWTTESSVTPMGNQDIKAWRDSDREIFLKNEGWIYDKPSISSQVIGDLVGGSILEKSGGSGNFSEVSTPDGRRGFVENQNVKSFNAWKSSVLCSEETICNVAKTFMGLPYLWGGSSTKGADCSGFVQSVFFRNGLILQRDASLQAQHGSSVNLTDDFINLKEGDLLFFGTNDNSKQRVTHVGIYLGNKEYINSSGLVQVNSLDSTRSNFRRYRLNSLLSARRVIGTTDDAGITAVNKHPWY